MASVTNRSTFGQTKLLSEERERELLGRWVDDHDQRALDELITSHKPLVLKIASRYRNYGLPLSDLAQEGYVGLMEAAHRFDLEREVRFATYAQWWIKSAIQDFVLRNGSSVRTVTSSRQKSLLFTLRKLLSAPEADNMPSPEMRDTLATRFSVSAASVDRMAQRLSVRDQSLDAEFGASGGLSLRDMLADDGPSPEEIVSDSDERHHHRAWLAEALAELPERERRIIVERHLGEDKPILRDLGAEFGVSKERVRQLEKRAFERLRAAMIERRDTAGA
jgi:RNA polymerase sigma-32 factor